MQNDRETATAITVTGLHKQYGTTKAVDGISFTVQTAEVFGILGPNGAGKTTTIEIIEGLRSADSGSVSILGLTGEDRKAIKERIGTQLQTPSLYPNLRVSEVINLFRTFYPKRRCLPTDALIKLLGLEQKKSSLVKNLSEGQKQRLNVALALVNDPEVVFLDEPTTGMDPQARRQLWDIILDMKERGKTVILTTHFMDEAQHVCGRVAIIDHGRIIEMNSPTNLVHKYFKDTVIELRGARRHGTGSYRSLPCVTDVMQGDNIVTLHTTGLPQTMAALMHYHMAEAGTMNVRSATLEDVFLKLTGRALRD